MKKYLIGCCLIISVVLSASFTSALITTYTYDAAGRLARADYDIDASISYTYDVNGNLVQRIANTDEVIGTPGDLNADDEVDLKDIIIVLQVLSGQQPDSTIDASNSIDNDSQIGIHDAIHILGQLANN